MTRFWVVKGRPGRNDLEGWLLPGHADWWVTRRPPRGWSPGDGVFVWEGAPKSRIVGLARVSRIRPPKKGTSDFRLEYLTRFFEAPLTIDVLRRQSVLRSASFLKSGPSGTVFPIETREASHVVKMLRRHNKLPRAINWDRAPRREKRRALSIRQPWAELIMAGHKTIEVRAITTKMMRRIYVYASLASVDDDDIRRVRKNYSINPDALPHGVVVGTVEIVGCRKLRSSDGKAACFPVGRRPTGFAWLLARPERTALRRPTGRPQPVFFIPFLAK